MIGKKIILAAAIFGGGAGFGFMATLAMTLNNKPAIEVETKWKTITTAPPPTYSPETLWHQDNEAICQDYVPPTTSTTSAPILTPPVSQPVPTTGSTQPPSTQPPLLTTSTGN